MVAGTSKFWQATRDNESDLNFKEHKDFTYLLVIKFKRMKLQRSKHS